MAKIHFDYLFRSTANNPEQHKFHTFLLSEYDNYACDLNKWHDQLNAELSKKIPSWWYAAGSRLIAWEPPIFNPLFFAIALKKFRIENKIKSLKITNSPEELELYLKDIDPTYHYEFVLPKENSLQIKSKFKQLLSPYWELTKLFRDALFFSKKLPSKTCYDLAIYSHFWGIKKYNQSYDHFYGNMFHEIPANKKIVWIYANAARITKLDKDMLREKLKNSGDVIFIEDHWSLKDALEIFIRSIKHRIAMRRFLSCIKPLIIDGQENREFTTFFAKEMLLKPWPITEFKTEVFFKKLYRHQFIQRIIYPFEDKCLERAILYTANNNVKTYGYAHAIYNSGHMYLDKKFGIVGTPPRPDYIVSTGPVAAENLNERTGMSVNKIKIAGSSRYPNTQIENLYKKNTPFRILLLSSQPYEINIFANWVSEELSIFNKIEVEIRKHPFAYQDSQNQGIERLRTYINICPSSPNFKEQLDRCDVIIFSSSSAGFEAILAGKIGIYANLNHIIPLNPFSDKGTSSQIFKAMNAQQLVEIIKNLESLSAHELSSLLKEQQQFVRGLYNKPDISFLWE